MDKDHNDIITREEFYDYLANPTAVSTAHEGSDKEAAAAARATIPEPDLAQL